RSRRSSGAVPSSTSGATTATSSRRPPGRQPTRWRDERAIQSLRRLLLPALVPVSMLTRLALGLIWLVHWLSFRGIARVGRAVGWLGYRLAVPRRKVVLVNLGLCFPELTEAERDHLARRHFSTLGRAFLDRSILWYAPEARVKEFVRLENAELYAAAK